MMLVLRLCHPFLSREAKKLRAIMMLVLRSSSDISMLPTAQAMQVTFLSWNLTEALWSTTRGNLWILARIGPTTAGTFLRTESEARRVWYFLAHFLTSFLSLLIFLRVSRSVNL